MGWRGLPELGPLGFPSGPLGFVSRCVFSILHVSFEEDSVNTLRKVGLGSPGCAERDNVVYWKTKRKINDDLCADLFGEIKVRKLGPYLAVVKFFVRFRKCSGDRGWEVIVPGKNVI